MQYQTQNGDILKLDIHKERRKHNGKEKSKSTIAVRYTKLLQGQ
jgi:hypothetical protein